MGGHKNVLMYQRGAQQRQFGKHWSSVCQREDEVTRMNELYLEPIDKIVSKEKYKEVDATMFGTTNTLPRSGSLNDEGPWSDR